MCVCVLKKDGIFINWSLWTIVGFIILPKPLIEYGLSSNQTRTNDIRNVVLLVVDPSSIHHYIFWVWPMLSPCSHDGGSPVIWKFRWVAVEPISSILSPPWIMLNINLVLETCVSISSCFVHEAYVWMKVVISLIHVHMMQVAAMNLRKIVLFSWNHSKLVMHTCEVFCGLETCNLHSICVPSTPSHWLICSRRRSSFIRASPELCKDFDTLADGSPSWTR